jgi:caffeoyl-CoA O-methyltransferase
MPVILLLTIVFALALPSYSQAREAAVTILDEKVKTFLHEMRNQWRDLNVPAEDGKILYDIIVKNRYKRALEIGTSTGHSAVWIAWALSKTGGRLITIEIDEGRYRQALANFEKAGLSGLIDARNADAHELVQDLAGHFDFIFIDADKEGYVNYAKALIPKLEPSGCIAAHNVRDRGTIGGRVYLDGTDRYYQYMKSLPEFETRLHPESPAGMSMSFKKVPFEPRRDE